MQAGKSKSERRRPAALSLELAGADLRIPKFGGSKLTQ
jgi:hypothetical protein